MTTAFVLSGGAALGSVQVGMLQALQAHGVRADLVIGTSVGAVNAAWIAGDPSGERLDELERVWVSLKRNHIFPARPSGLFGLVGRRTGFVDQLPLRRLLTKHLRFDRLEQAPIPVHVIVTDVLSGRDVRLSDGPAVDSVLASSAIPGVFAPVVIAGRPYMDGGLVNNAAISHAVALGATTVYVLPTGWSCALERPPMSAFAMAMHGLNVLVQHRLADDVEHYRGDVDVRVVPPPCPIRVGPADFGHGAQLVEAGRTSAKAWLANETDIGLRRLRDHHDLVVEHVAPST